MTRTTGASRRADLRAALRPLAGRFWREGLLLALRILPWLPLPVLGLVWLYQTGWLLWWGVAAAAVSAAALPVARAVRRRAASRAAALLGAEAPPEGLTAREHEARALVEKLALATTAADVATRDAALDLAGRTVQSVAAVFHPARGRAWAEFTLAEALALVETAAAAMHAKVTRLVPGSDTVRLGWILHGAELLERHGPKARIAWHVFRALRLVADPVRGAAAELQARLDGGSTDALTLTARTAAAQLLVRETGYAAIQLYSGRLARGDRGADLRREPLRILVAGQVNAGKSSLVNALAEAMHCEVGPVPVTAEFREVRLIADGFPEIVLVDSPGLDGGRAAAKRLAAEVPAADAILWVAAANQSARAPDVAALRALGGGAEPASARPPILLAVTHCDRLPPAREWAPPYDVAVAGAVGKAASIREAVAAAAAVLGIDAAAAVPLALPPGAPPWNLDGLRAALARLLPVARQRQHDRKPAGGGGAIRRLLSQAYGGGRALSRLTSGRR